MPDCTAETPAARATRLLGPKRLAAACDLTTNAIYKWVKSPDGRIPSRHQPAVLALAKRMNVAFSAEDLIGVAA